MKPKTMLRVLVAILLVAAISLPGSAQSKKSVSDDVAIELVGQVINPNASTSIQFGYLSYINGIDNIFNAVSHNETTALFTFYNETFNTQVITNGPLRIINRVGTSTIYLDTTPDGDFASPDSFRDGTPVVSADVRVQVILDTTAAVFTATFVLTITSVDVFRMDNQNLHLGRIGQKLRLTFIGHGLPPTANIAGFVIGGDLTRP